MVTKLCGTVWPHAVLVVDIMGYISNLHYHDDVIKWIHFPRFWPFVRGIHRSPVNSSHKGQWRWALMFSLICAQINDREAVDLRHHCAHYDVIVMASAHSRYSSIGLLRHDCCRCLDDKQAIPQTMLGTDRQVNDPLVSVLSPVSSFHSDTAPFVAQWQSSIGINAAYFYFIPIKKCNRIHEWLDYFLQ